MKEKCPEYDVKKNCCGLNKGIENCDVRGDSCCCFNCEIHNEECTPCSQYRRANKKVKI